MAVLINRMNNGSFETGLTGWTAQNVVIASTPALSGFAAARLQGGANNARLVQSITADPGDTFQLKLSVARDSTGTTPIVAVSIAYFNADNEVIGFGLVENIRPAAPSALRYQNVYQNTSPAPPGTVRAEVTIERQGATGTANVFIDQIILLQVITDATGAVPVLFPSIPSASQQSDDAFRLFSDSFTNLLEVNVTTTVPNQRVKIDAVVEVEYESVQFTEMFQSFVDINLNRSGVQLTGLDPIRFVRIFDGIEANKRVTSTAFATLTHVDVVAQPGMYNYTVDGTVSFEFNPNDIIQIQTRGLNATVFPPAAGGGPV